MRIERATDFGRVAVVIGGDGPEREVSLDGGRDVLDALLAQDVNAEAVDGIPRLLSLIGEGQVDRVFNLLHGRGGEDGTLQGALKCLQVPVTGAGLLGAALTLDKSRSKALWRQAGLPVIPGAELKSLDEAERVAGDLGFPLVVKPVCQGSSVGVSVVDRREELPAALALAREHNRRVMLETFIEGDELTVSIVDAMALPAIRIVPADGFYDYNAKYIADSTRYEIPCGLDEQGEHELRETALKAFAAAGASGWGRVDFLRGADGQCRLLEANTTPGMTSHSLVPKAAAAAGMDFKTLVWRILETSFDEVIA
ncbi:MAG: D-alanine--D-alanine ligase [Pseudomonadota bacterium]